MRYKGHQVGDETEIISVPSVNVFHFYDCIMQERRKVEGCERKAGR